MARGGRVWLGEGEEDENISEGGLLGVVLGKLTASGDFQVVGRFPH